MGLVQQLPEGPLDIVGDIHGEDEALCALLSHLGYDEAGQHPQGRTLVFVGDLCDRGPDSPAVFDLVERLIGVWRTGLRSRPFCMPELSTKPINKCSTRSRCSPQVSSARARIHSLLGASGAFLSGWPGGMSMTNRSPSW